MSDGGASVAPACWGDRAASWARRRWFPAAVAGLAVVFALPALGAGWIMDDYYHRTILLGRSRFSAELGTPSEMFRFFRGEPGRTGRLVDIGLFPWWTDPHIKGEFLQALTVLTHRLDYALWPDSVTLMHAHSLFWLGAATAAASVLYRRLLGPTWVAVVAALLYALDDARGATVGFIANRNVLIAATFGFLSLACHDRWRREGSRTSAVLAVLLLTVALFCKEEGIGTCAYLGAYALFLDPRGRWRGLLALVPYVVVVMIWRTLRDSWGFGVWNVGWYIDPVTEPLRFARAALARIPVLLLGQWTPIPSDVTVIFAFPPASTVLWSVSVALLAFIGLAMAPLLRRDPRARFWASGMVFATVPVAATLPMDRLFTFVGLGASGLLAQFLADAFGAANSSRGWRTFKRGVAWSLVIVHAVIAPLFLPFRAGNPIGPKWIEHRFNVATPLGPDIEGKTLVVVDAASPMHAGYVLLQRDVEGLPIPRFIRVLAPAMPSVAIRRLDDRTLAIRPGKGYLNWAGDRVFRNERRPLTLGEHVRLTGLNVEITSLTPDGRPAEATFRFDVPLEDPSLVWLEYRDGRFVPFTLPAPGHGVEIPFKWWPVLDPFAKVDELTTP